MGSGDLAMTPAMPGCELGRVTPDVLPSHQHHCNVSTSDAVQIGRQQWRMARAQMCHRDALISGLVMRPAMVRMLHVGKYSVNTCVRIAVVPYGGNGVLVGNECCRCRNEIQASCRLR